MSRIFNVLLLILFIFVSYCQCNESRSPMMRRNSAIEDSSKKKNITENTRITCTDPSFHPVGDYCLFVDNRLRGTWYEMREACQALGGDLVNLNDANILYHISNYIKDNAIGDVSFWVGATDQNLEGSWVWVSDNSSVKMGTPLWGRLYGQEPNGDVYENCAILSLLDFFYMHDDVCDFPSHGAICQEGTSKQPDLKDAIFSENRINQTPKECPPNYVRIRNTCLHINNHQDFSWNSAKSYCEGEGTHLVKLDDANLLGALYDYLTANSINLRAWVDGTDEATEDSWIFYDGTPVKRGTPFWFVLSESEQEPNSATSGNCVNIRYDETYYFVDGSCGGDSGVVCQFDTY